MDAFHFIIRFDDDNHQLTAENGLSIEEVAIILNSLSKAVSSDDEKKIVLSAIRGNCYALELTTESVDKFEELKIVHRRIEKGDFWDLSKEQKSYATTLHSILENRKYHLRAYDKDKQFIARIDKVYLPEESAFYYNRGAVYGKITSIGGKSIDGAASIDVSGIPYSIKVSPQQERELLMHYKKERIRFLVRKKLRIEQSSEKVLEASLLSFEVPISSTFEDAVEQISTHRKAFRGVKDSVKEVRKLRD